MRTAVRKGCRRLMALALECSTTSWTASGEGKRPPRRRNARSREPTPNPTPRPPPCPEPVRAGPALGGERSGVLPGPRRRARGDG